MTTRETYVDDVKLELDGLNDQLHSFETKVTHARLDARERYVADVARLRGHSWAALAKWHELQGCTEEMWRLRVTDMDHLRDDFKRAFREFKARL